MANKLLNHNLNVDLPGELSPGALAKTFVLVSLQIALNIYSAEKARLQKSGKIIDDFDLLIGATAISFDLTTVTNQKFFVSGLYL